jgi:putative Mg2+ transporter-C (MgtC) family protein
MPTQWDLVLRLIAAIALGGAIGAEREYADQPAGFRTHALVGLGAALFTIISAYGFDVLVANGPPSAMRADVTRVVSQIVVGIGFLGGGAILKDGASIRGLTTAASLWITAAVGTAAGVGAWTWAIVTTAMALGALSGLRPLRRVIRRHGQITGDLQIGTAPKGDIAGLLGSLEATGATLRRVHVADGDRSREVQLQIKLPASLEPKELTQRVANLSSVISVDWVET